MAAEIKYKIFQMNPYIGEDEIIEMQDSINQNWITEGPKSKKFIETMLEYTGAKYGVLANNGTVALYLALKGAGIGEGDEVIVSDFSFFASAGAIHWAGAKPIFVDVRLDDLNIDSSKIESKITKKTKAIMPVHIYGRSADMDPILELAKKYNLKVIEDACQGLGVYYKKKRHTGSMGDAGCFSFFADKTITTGGEGGMVITNDEEIYKNMLYFRNQGRIKSGTFIHPCFGINFRMTDLAAGFGLAQFKKLDYIIKKKLENYRLYQELLKEVKNVKIFEETKYSNFIPFRINVFAKNLSQLMDFMDQNGVQTRGCFYPLHKQPIFSNMGFNDNDYPNSIYAFENAMSLPAHLGLTKEDIKYICGVINNFYKKNVCEEEKNNFVGDLQVEQQPNISNLKIAIATHVDTTGPSQNLLEFCLLNKADKTLFIGHPLYQENQFKSHWKLYEQGVLIREHERPKRKQMEVLKYAKEVILNLYWIVKSREKWDLYIGSDNLNAFSGIFLKWLGKVDKVVYYAIDFVPHRFESKILDKIYHWVDKFCVKHCDITWNLSPRMIEGREEYLNLNKKYRKKQILVPEGVWLDRIERLPIEQINLHHAVFLGQLKERLGVHKAIEAVPKILQSIPDFKFIIIGKGGDKEKFEKLACDLGVSEHIDFKGFIPDHRDAEKIIAQCAVGIATYSDEERTFSYFCDPSKTKIYMGCGLPVVMTDVFYNAKEIENAGAGKVVNFNSDEIAQAVVNIMSDRNRLEKYRKNAVDYVQNLDWNIVFKKSIKEGLL